MCCIAHIECIFFCIFQNLKVRSYVKFFQAFLFYTFCALSWGGSFDAHIFFKKKKKLCSHILKGGRKVKKERKKKRKRKRKKKENGEKNKLLNFLLKIKIFQVPRSTFIKKFWGERGRKGKTIFH